MVNGINTIGKIDTTTAIDPTDFRANSPRFTAEARDANSGIVDLVRRVADEKGATPAQVALAWLLAKEPWIVPIFGTRRLDRVQENLGAADVVLTAEDLSDLAVIGSTLEAHGARLSEAMLQLSYR